MRRAILASVFTLLVASPALAQPPGPRLSTGPFNVAAGIDSVASARAAILQAAPHAQQLSLSESFTMGAAGSARVVRFAQRHNGVPVLFRGAGARLRADGTPAWVVVRLEDVLPNTTPTVSRARAAELATSIAHLPAKESDATLAIFPMNSGLRLAWVVVPSERIPGLPWAPVVIVDAKTEQRLASWNAAVFAGAAKVYESNPIASPNLVDVTLPVDVGKTTLENARVKSLNCVDTKQVKAIDMFGFKLNVHVCELQQKAVADTNGDFPDAPGTDTEPEDAFSEISMFFHVNRAYDYFASLGMTDLATKPLPTVSNLRLPAGYETQDLSKMSDPNLPLVPFQNAFFAPANPIFSNIFGLTGAAMWFGQGPLRDYSYDGDVVYHEFTHAVVDHTLKLVGTWHADEQGLIDSPGAMNEALSDYFSSALTGDPKVGEYAAKDLSPGLTSIRDLSNQFVCPDNVVGEVHVDSEFWSAGLWSVRAGLSPADQGPFDKALFDVMAASPGGDLGFEDLSQLFVDSVKATVSQTASDALAAEMGKRGALPACKRVREWSGKAINGSAPLYANALVAPGTGSTALGKVAYAPGVLQIHVPVPAAGTLTLQFSEVKGGSSSGSGFPFGGGTPFTPKMLVRWGEEPITFTYDSDVQSTADAMVDAPLSSSKGAASVEIPAGTTSAYVMIVNAGQQDGLYKSVTFEFSGDAADAGADAGTDDAGADAGTGNGAGSDDSDDGGCGCQLAPAPGGLGALAALALLLGGLSRRRRGRR